MKLLFDENISYRIVKKLKLTNSECIHNSRTPLNHACSDHKIWDYAKSHDYIIVTFDEDFKDLINLYSFPPKVILLRMGNSGTTFLTSTIQNKMPEINSFAKSDIHGLLEIF